MVARHHVLRVPVYWVCGRIKGKEMMEEKIAHSPDGGKYSLIGYIIGVITFFLVWYISFQTWGMTGLLLGWILAGAVAAFAGLLWPLTLLVLGAVLLIQILGI